MMTAQAYVVTQRTTKESPINTYLSRFKGIGTFEGTFHKTLKDDAQPVIQPPRKYPIYIKDELAAELLKNQQAGSITLHLRGRVMAS